jgi:divalent metal cation (Fe/Co/Zn/Cd) transporter
MSTPLPLPTPVPSAPSATTPHRTRLVRRARTLAWLGVGWHAIEAGVAIGAGVLAGSVALTGFGADSLIEALAGLVVLWRLASSNARAEQRAQQIVAVSFYAIAGYIALEAIRSLAGADQPAASWIGIGLALVTLTTMPPLAAAKAHVAEALESSATKSESRQAMLCAYLSAGLLVGLGLNALLGWWWADPATALAIAAAAVNEGRHAGRGEACCTAPLAADDDDRPGTDCRPAD